jgi:hypothetical protein
MCRCSVQSRCLLFALLNFIIFVDAMLGFFIWSMSEDEDDYLANIDKFVVDATASAPKTYSQIRKEAAKKAKLKNDQNKLKSRRQREVESRAEGLSKSLFERAKEEEDAGLVSGNKALSIMMKMGFKPGQALGKTDDEESNAVSEQPTDAEVPPDDPVAGPSNPDSSAASKRPQHKVEPLPINEWAGRSVVLMRIFPNKSGFHR